MANTYTIVGNGEVIITGAQIGSNYVVEDFVKGDAIIVEAQGDISNMDVGKNKDAIIAFDANGLKANVSLSVISGGLTDRLLSLEAKSYEELQEGYILLKLAISGKFGDGSGNVRSCNYQLGGGTVMRYPTLTRNYSGDTEQGMVRHTLQCMIEKYSFL